MLIQKYPLLSNKKTKIFNLTNLLSEWEIHEIMKTVNGKISCFFLQWNSFYKLKECQYEGIFNLFIYLFIYLFILFFSEST
jgi:hypothetical protein